MAFVDGYCDGGVKCCVSGEVTSTPVTAVDCQRNPSDRVTWKNGGTAYSGWASPAGVAPQAAAASCKPLRWL